VASLRAELDQALTAAVASASTAAALEQQVVALNTTRDEVCVRTISLFFLFSLY
jgi:hypothetical protein